MLHTKTKSGHINISFIHARGVFMDLIKFDFSKPKNYSRTHEITINSTFYPKDTKSFSLWCNKDITSETLIEYITEIIDNISVYLNNYIEVENIYDSKAGKKTHIAIVKSCNGGVSKSKKFLVSSMNSEQVAQLVSFRFGCKLRGVER